MSSGSEKRCNTSRTRKRGFSDVDSSSSESSDEEVVRTKPRRKCFIIDEDVESDSDGSINMARKRRVARMSSSSSSSDDSSDNSDAEVIRIVRKKTAYKLASSEDDSSEWEDESVTKSSKDVEEESSSDSCDGQSEKCPICFIKFRNQEVGTPASCEHSFCVGCIQEWSKSVNTCPVDRIKFNEIRVRKCYANKDYYKTIPVEEPTTDAFDELDAVIDLTVCEICASFEHEDRLLLCDGCDGAYHLDCLTPPLAEVPPGNWFCENCDFRNPSDLVNFDLVSFAFISSSSRRPVESFTASRLIPRTRQSERIRTRIVYQRGQRQNPSAVNESLANENDISQPGPSTSTTRRPRITKKKIIKKRKKMKTKRAKYKITYEIDETTGAKMAIKTKTRKYRRKKKKTRKSKLKFKRVMVPKSVKERLAKQLGMCAPKTPGQTLPDVKVQTIPNSIATQRSQAGLPSLHLFAPRNELEYFSESESEVDGGGGVNILMARRPNRSDVSVLRRAARNKAAISITPLATESTDLLGSILNSQAQLHSKNSALSLKKDGTVKIDINENVKKVFPDQNNRSINLGSADSYVHRRPMVPNTSGNEGGSYNANMNNSRPCDNRMSNTVPTSTVEFSNIETSNNFRRNDDSEDVQNYSMHGRLDNYEVPQNSKEKQKKNEEKEEKEVPNGSPGNSGSELDIYSDIETVSTSKIYEQEAKCPTPPPPNLSNMNLYDDNESESDLIIDTEKAESDKYDPMTMYESEDETTKEEETVTSTSEPVNVTRRNDFTSPTLSSEIQSETVQSSNQNEYYLCKSFADEEEKDKQAECDNEEPSDDCPNFSIYSAESINLAKNSELNIMMAQNEAAKTTQIDETPPSPVKKDEEKPKTNITKKSPLKKRVHTGLYSDSEDESLIKIDQDQPFGFSDIRNLTEDISEEERSYTPCLDEKEPSSLREGLAGLDTEMISDDDKNDFEETQEMKTASDGDALEINAKESELDFTRPEDCEEGEIIDKSKTKIDESVPKEVEKEAISEVIRNDEIEGENKEPVFKKLSKSNKERNYRDKENKERERSKSKEKKDNKSKEKEIREREMRENNRRERQRKEKRREIARYNVRSLVETKPKRDKFGRDPTRRRSRSNTRKRTPSTSRSPSPTLRNARDDMRRKSQSLSSDSSASRRYGKDVRGKSYSTSRSRSPHRRSISRGRKSHSPGRRKRRGRTASRSKSRGRKPRSRSRLRKRPRSVSRDRVKPRKRSNDKANDKLKRKRKRDRSESRSPSRRREWVGRRRSREWTPSMSHSRSPEPKHFTPSWTPPRMMNQTVRPQNLTVILPNDSNKKKKDKKKKQERKTKEAGGVPEKQKKRRRSERSPLPSKEVFASGNNILVSVSFNKDNNEVRTEKVRRKRDSNASEDLSTRRVRKENNPVKTPVKRKQRVKNVSNIKPVAIIDLDRSPFKELTPSPKDIIVLSDSDNGDSNDLMGLQNALNQQSPQQAASPEVPNNSNYMNSMGPKTPPEPQVKFTFSSKQPQLRAISNPLHDPDDDHEQELDPQEELENRLNEVTHKGPNTPPEPPNSPPSSPDAYDPFDPTKSRTPSPEPKQSNAQSSISQIIDDSQEEIEDISESIDLTEKNSPLQVSKSHTPPISVADIQPADSQSSVRAITPDTNQGSSPERSIAVVINQVVQSQSASLFPSSTPITYSSNSTSLITSTPISSNLSVPRINILSSAILTPPVVTSSVSQRSLIPNTTKASPINKVSPSKAPAKSSTSKGSSKLPSKNANWKNKNRSNENNDGTNLDLDSPYSPGSSDYEDLFEPPPETTKSAPVSKANMAATATAAKTNNSGKGQNTFDVLFGSSPVYANKKQSKTKPTKAKKSTTHHTSKGTKQVGVKLDEDNLKILDELPNSAVEMQVKDKFLKKLNRQERVVEEVKFVLKPYYNKKRITKEEYKDILRRAVPKICHNKSGEINPQKIQQLIEAYIKKSKHSKKVTSSSSTVNPQKTEVVSNWLSKLN